jgi:putative hydrolase of the HAD superfamily
MGHRQRLRIVLFDLDETLYPRGSGVMGQIRARILRYMIDRLELDPDTAEKLRMHYLHTYGTSMRGLQIHHAIDPDDFLHYVHDFPIEEFIPPSPRLDAVLGRLPLEKVIFTNASREHAERVLGWLGISHHFKRIVDVRDLQYVSKPNPEAYVRVCALLHVEPDECMLVEDSARNLQPAKELGMVTVLVDGSANQSADYIIPTVLDIESVPVVNSAGGMA